MIITKVNERQKNDKHKKTKLDRQTPRHHPGDQRRLHPSGLLNRANKITKGKKMTQEQKQEWLRNATADELLRQYVEFQRTNEYGQNDDDIALTKAEIKRRMGNNQ